MTNSEIRRTIREVMAATFEIDPDEIDNQTRQQDIDSWTSLAHLRLITNLEQALNLRFTMKEATVLISYAEIEKTVLAKNS
ncbi:MAG: acyl carrier protein [Chloroflexota bacterium]|nr:acyl carrier protein [Chloroflexota bacterium]